eukprot:571578_1
MDATDTEHHKRLEHMLSKLVTAGSKRTKPHHNSSRYQHQGTIQMSTNGGEDLERMVDERREGKLLKFSSNWMYCKRNGQNMNHTLDMCNGGVFAVMDDCNNMILLLLDYAHVD